MSSRRRQEGYLLVDHRASPGLDADALQSRGLHPGMGRGTFESSTITCSHCQRVVVMNPDRSRERGYCQKCDHYVCDTCNLVRVQTGECRNYRAFLDQLNDKVVRQAQNSRILGL